MVAYHPRADIIALNDGLQGLPTVNVLNVDIWPFTQLKVGALVLPAQREPPSSTTAALIKIPTSGSRNRVEGLAIASWSRNWGKFTLVENGQISGTG